MEGRNKWWGLCDDGMPTGRVKTSKRQQQSSFSLDIATAIDEVLKRLLAIDAQFACEQHVRRLLQLVAIK